MAAPVIAGAVIGGVSSLIKMGLEIAQRRKELQEQHRNQQISDAYLKKGLAELEQMETFVESELYKARVFGEDENQIREYGTTDDVELEQAQQNTERLLTELVTQQEFNPASQGNIDLLTEVRDNGRTAEYDANLEATLDNISNRDRASADALRESLSNRGYDPGRVGLVQQITGNQNDANANKQLALALSKQFENSKIGAVQPLESILNQSFNRRTTGIRDLASLEQFNTGIKNRETLYNDQKNRQVLDRNTALRNQTTNQNLNNQETAYRDSINSRNNKRGGLADQYNRLSDIYQNRSDQNAQAGQFYGQQAGNSLNDGLYYGGLAYNEYLKQRNKNSNTPYVDVFSSGVYDNY